MMRSRAGVRPREFVPFSGQAHFLWKSEPFGEPAAARQLISLPDVPEPAVPEPAVPAPALPDVPERAVQERAVPDKDEEEEEDVETIVESQDWTPGLFDEEPFEINNDNDGFDMLINDGDGPDLVECINAVKNWAKWKTSPRIGTLSLTSTSIFES